MTNIYTVATCAVISADLIGMVRCEWEIIGCWYKPLWAHNGLDVGRDTEFLSKSV